MDFQVALIVIDKEERCRFFDFFLEMRMYLDILDHFCIHLVRAREEEFSRGGIFILGVCVCVCVRESNSTELFIDCLSYCWESPFYLSFCPLMKEGGWGGGWDGTRSCILEIQ